MYYELTKEQLKKYEKNFRKTYIGKQYFLSYFITALIALFFLIDILVSTFFDGGNIVDLESLCYLFIMLSFIIGTILAKLTYDKEFKEYILSQNK